MRSISSIAALLARRFRRTLPDEPSLTEEEAELQRLGALPRRVKTKTYLRGRSLHVNDGCDFVHMFRNAFYHQTCRFECETEHPLIIDCGANLGITVLYWKSLFPNSRIVAMEADPVICDMLRHNCGWMSDISILEAAAWNEEGELDFNMEGNVGGHLAALSERTDQGETVKVRAIRLRDLLCEKVDFLKLDIEGAEVDVLADCFDRLSCVDRIFVEYHAFADRDQRIGQFFTLLEDAGYIVHVHDELPADQPFIRRPVINGKHHRLNVFATRNGLPETVFLPSEDGPAVGKCWYSGELNCGTAE